MPIGSLPPKAAKLFDKVYRAELAGECKDDKACASKRAWGAVKNAGYFKGKDGKWHKRSDIEMSMAEMSLYISKASFDKKTQQMRWSAVASDTDLDEYDEKMSVGLYNDFIRRAIEKEAPPEELCTEGWCGGMPYLSLAHYSDLDGEGIVGPTSNLYVDGKKLKGQGTFKNNALGRACFNSICEDLYSEEKSDQEKIRISIGFLDWAHNHGDIKFERKKLTDRCPMCAIGIGDKMFAKGHLLHLALTRVPVNARTDILPLVEESMVTQKEDAESIVGKEKAEELDDLEKEAELVDKSEAVVERAEEDEEEAEVEKEETAESETVESPAEEVVEEVVEEAVEEAVETEADETEVQTLSKKLDQISELISPKAEPHALDTVFETLRSQYDDVIEMEDLTSDEKLQLLQSPFEEIGNVLRSGVSVEAEEDAQGVPVDAVTRAELKELLTPLTEQVSLLVAQMEGGTSANVVRTTTSRQRSISPLQLKVAVPKEEKPDSIEAISKKSVGITSY